MAMDAQEKKRLANEKRLKAIHEWKKNRNLHSVKVEAKPVRVNFEELGKKNIPENKLTLFNSDGEEDNFEDDFHVRPQFEGAKGQELLELNAELSSRFKLDERFKEDDDLSETNAAEINEEKVKNIKILESVLGYEVAEKFPEGKSVIKKKRLMRFDPEDENASKYLKANDISEEHPQTKVRKKKEKEELNKEKSKKYLFLLKDILNNETDNDSNTGFSFSFGTKEDSQVKQIVPKNKKEEPKTSKQPQQTRNIFENRQKFQFFIAEDDDKLKEGVEFFQRKRTLEEIHDDWNKRKADVMELFRRKRKSNQRGFVTRIKASQKNKAYAKK
ncbi:Nucleolar protein 8 like protein [Argiope bruennichi]|uniref:Nucleolar protein 8 like protein n=1 Tax=Argiope bruennichi TaxID=94029 RepID=A0A8T0E416_ARGBR|nr:Nucleolar protein 8 like protein [Argiope bruennichi]